MRLLHVDPLSPSTASVDEAVRVLRSGGLVAFPTETVYGLGADATSSRAIARIFEAKARPAHNPLIVHVADTEAARAVGVWNDTAELLAEAFWPGPLTLILARSPAITPAVSAGLNTVAIRVPAHPVAQALLARCALPIAAPSANPYTQISPTTAAHVRAGLGDRVDLILDGGPCSVGIESTVIRVDTAVPQLLRLGMVTEAALRVYLPELRTEPDVGPAHSPGLARRHYAPRATVRLNTTEGSDGYLRRGSPEGEEIIGETVTIRLPSDPRLYAAGLYAALHRFDTLHVRTIAVEPLPNDPSWDAVRDRLTRAATDSALNP